MSGTNGGYGKNRPRFTDAERQDVLSRHDDGESVRSIAAAYDVTQAAIYYHLKTTLRHVPLADRDDVPKNTPPTIPQEEPVSRDVGGASLSLVPQGDWVLDALCAEVDNEIFFPDKGGSNREAKSICIDCPVAAECLDYALANNERFGIWGGLSERERRGIALGVDFDDSACGTYPKGYNRHGKHGVPICDDCRLAANAYAQNYRDTGTRAPVDISVDLTEANAS